MQRNSLVTNSWKAAASAALLLAATHASAADITYNFGRITNNYATDLASQLSITLWDAAGANAEFNNTALVDGQVLFTVMNAVGTQSSISEVYFDDGLLGPSQVINSLGGFTNFTGGSVGVNPGNLPAGENVGFQATAGFSVDTANGPPSNGVNTSTDILGIVFGAGDLVNFAGVAAAVADGSLRFGLHVRDLQVVGADGSTSTTSDSFVNEVPLPAAVWLFGSALIGFAGISRRKTKAKTS
jgi:hypothetical protein